MQRKHREDEAI